MNSPWSVVGGRRGCFLLTTYHRPTPHTPHPANRDSHSHLLFLSQDSRLKYTGHPRVLDVSLSPRTTHHAPRSLIQSDEDHEGRTAKTSKTKSEDEDKVENNPLATAVAHAVLRFLVFRILLATFRPRPFCYLRSASDRWSWNDGRSHSHSQHHIVSEGGVLLRHCHWRWLRSVLEFQASDVFLVPRSDMSIYQRRRLPPFPPRTFSSTSA